MTTSLLVAACTTTFDASLLQSSKGTAGGDVQVGSGGGGSAAGGGLGDAAGNGLGGADARSEADVTADGSTAGTDSGEDATVEHDARVADDGSGESGDLRDGSDLQDGGGQADAGSDVLVDASTFPPGTSPPSCQGLAVDCGASRESCCASPLLPPGTLDRLTGRPATVSSFRLDRYEVTVGRFRKFLRAWDQGWRPAAGSGKHTHLNQGRGLAAPDIDYEQGWDPSWVARLPAAVDDWHALLTPCSQDRSWTATPGENERRPMGCFTWFEAYAFCIWDNGFLPSVAESIYASVAGAESRFYPWSGPPGSMTVDCSYANYHDFQLNRSCSSMSSAPPFPIDVGSTSPKGDGKWGHSDLMGNADEWALDWEGFPSPCTDCANLSPTKFRFIRGGSYATSASSNTSYSAVLPDYRVGSIGARCARVP